MVESWSNWIEAGINGSSTLAWEQGALAYLTVALLGPLGWMCAVEICRRMRGSRGERKAVPARNAAARLAVPIANWKKPALSKW